jgi:hypothetical protein
VDPRAGLDDAVQQRERKKLLPLSGVELRTSRDKFTFFTLRPGFDCRKIIDFFSLFSTVSRPTLGPTQLCNQWVPGAVSPGVFFFIYLVCEAIGTAATPGLLCQPRVIMKMIVEK